MNFRQVHLDFHTGEKISEIGKDYNRSEFQAALKMGHVNSITVFSKCHHGWAYHPSKANEIHPHLNFDLLSEQISAAHEIGVRTPVYISAGLDEKMTRRHPEWLVRDIDEGIAWTSDFSKPGYHKFCFNSPYLDYLLLQIEEVCENYDADGIFLDIVGVQPCYCQNCIRSLEAEGKDPYNPENIVWLAERVYKNYTDRVRIAIDKHKKGLPVFHNGGHIRRGRRDLANMNTHLELESLPTGGWGYDHFPLSASYVSTLGFEYLGMTGKFHKSWGEFGGFKHPNALRYEMSLAAAFGAKSSIGDQLHPSGKMDIATYELIGKAYSELEEKEEYLDNCKNIADIAVLSTEVIDNYYKDANFSVAQSTVIGNSDSGAVRIMLEGKYLFDFIDLEADFESYSLIILPDKIKIDNFIKEKLDAYIKKGGKILASGESGLYIDKDEFALDFGIECLGNKEFVPDYFKPDFELKSLLNSAFVMYEGGKKIKNNSATEIAQAVNSYFNRDVRHFCSHRHTPPNFSDASSGMTVKNGLAYVSWNIFAEYAEHGSLAVKEGLTHVIDLLLGADKTLTTNLPAQGIARLANQNDRKILNLLYACPVKRGTDVEVIEDIIPIYNTTVKIKTDKNAKNVFLAPQNEKLDFTLSDGYIEFTVEKLENHQIVVVE